MMYNSHDKSPVFILIANYFKINTKYKLKCKYFVSKINVKKVNLFCLFIYLRNLIKILMMSLFLYFLLDCLFVKNMFFNWITIGQFRKIREKVCRLIIKQKFTISLYHYLLRLNTIFVTVWGLLTSIPFTSDVSTSSTLYCRFPSYFHCIHHIVNCFGFSKEF